MLFRLVKYLQKNRKNISRVILNGPFSPMDRLAPVSPTVKRKRIDSDASELDAESVDDHSTSSEAWSDSDQVIKQFWLE